MSSSKGIKGESIGDPSALSTYPVKVIATV